MRIEWLIDPEKDVVEPVFEAADLLGAPLLVVIGVPRSRPFYPLDGAVTVPRELVGMHGELTRDRWPGAIWHDYEAAPWEVGISVSEETWRRSGRAYLSYLLAHEAEHARIALESFPLHTTLVRYNDFISKKRAGQPFPVREPFEFMLDVAGMATASAIHGRESVDAAVTALLGSPRKDEERLRVQLTIPAENVDLAGVAQRMMQAAAEDPASSGTGGGASLFERFSSAQRCNPRTGALVDYVRPELIQAAADGVPHLRLGPQN